MLASRGDRRNPAWRRCQADDIAPFAHQTTRGYLALSRFLLRFIDRVPAGGSAEVGLGWSGDYVIGEAGLDGERLGLERRDHYYRAQLNQSSGRRRREVAMSTAERIAEKLAAALSPVKLEIVDESAQHAGHVGARPEGETHFRVKIIAESFAGKTRIDRQRTVYRILAEELVGGVHALALTTLSPEEVDAADL